MRQSLDVVGLCVSLMRVYVGCPDARVNTVDTDTLWYTMPPLIFHMKPTFFWVGLHRVQCTFFHANLPNRRWPPWLWIQKHHKMFSTPSIHGAISEGVVENEADVSPILSSSHLRTPQTHHHCQYLFGPGVWKLAWKPHLHKNDFS